MKSQAAENAPGDPIVHEFVAGMVGGLIKVSHVHKHTVGSEAFYMVIARRQADGDS